MSFQFSKGVMGFSLAVMGGVSLQAIASSDIDEISVTAAPLSLQTMSEAYGVIELTSDDLRVLPGLRLDEKLASIPSFSLFRRSGSQVAHPTAQGVTLRSVGPNGAGRTLVLLDGVPQGDPFGGWTNWGRLPLVDTESLYLVKGGGTGPWGSGALAGTLIMKSRMPDEAETRVNASVGSFETVDVSASTHIGDSKNGLTFSGNYFSSDGAYLIAENQRGLADVRAKGEGGWFRVRGKAEIAEGYSLTFSGGFSDEDRLNGTEYTGNGTRVWDAVIGFEKLAKTTGDWAIDANAYIRDQEFYSRFSAVADDRNSEGPALDQYSVPSDSKGANIVGRVELSDGWLLEVGADYRRTSGATNEQYFFSGGTFVRERSAGGEQALLGFFAETTKAITDTVDLSVGVRLDHWKNTGGFRRETNLTTDALILDDSFTDTSDWLPGGRVGFAWQSTESIRLFGSVYSGVRAPSLNELYRPFRVGSDITEANPALDIERLYGGEIGFSFMSHSASQLKVTYFRNYLQDGVGNITLTTAGGFYGPLGVFVPFGGSLSQRLNIDTVIVDGVEIDVHIPVHDSLTLDAAYFWNNARIHEASVNPVLEGNRLAQTPEHKGHVAVSWTPADKWLVRLSADMSSKQYDDDGNSRVLGGYVTADIYVSYDLREGLSLYAAGLNVADKTVVTGLRSNGLTSVAEPASWRIGVQAQF